MSEICEAALARDVPDNAEVDGRIGQSIVLVLHYEDAVADAGQVFAKIFVLMSFGQVDLEMCFEVADLDDAQIRIRSDAAMRERQPWSARHHRHADQQQAQAGQRVRRRFGRQVMSHMQEYSSSRGTEAAIPKLNCQVLFLLTFPDD